MVVDEDFIPRRVVTFRINLEAAQLCRAQGILDVLKEELRSQFEKTLDSL